MGKNNGRLIKPELIEQVKKILTNSMNAPIRGTEGKGYRLPTSPVAVLRNNIIGMLSSRGIVNMSMIHDEKGLPNPNILTKEQRFELRERRKIILEEIDELFSLNGKLCNN